MRVAGTTPDWLVVEDVGVGLTTALYARDALGLRGNGVSLAVPPLAPAVSVTPSTAVLDLSEPWNRWFAALLADESAEPADDALRAAVERLAPQAAEWISTQKAVIVQRTFLRSEVRRLVGELFRPVMARADLTEDIEFRIDVIPLAADWWTASGRRVALSESVRRNPRQLAIALEPLLGPFRRA